jgi:prepilin-type N-terminal cleavage/methylation domain-containing protein
LDRRGKRVRAISANRFPFADRGFTLLEIIIALVLVAILVSASVPFLFDSFAASAGERAMEAITLKARETRAEAMEKGEPRRLNITSTGLDGVPLPEGWTLEVQGLNDSRFHEPSRNQVWEFNPAGICEPLSIRLSQGDRQLTATFDALTGQPVPDEE